MPKNEIPDWAEDWVHNTTSEHSYQLIMFESDDAGVEDVSLSRDEYIALKRHIAAVRGWLLPDNLEVRIEELASQTGENDSNQTAQKLAIARKFYRLCPELVVADSRELEEELKRIELIPSEPNPAAPSKPRRVKRQETRRRSILA